MTKRISQNNVEPIPSKANPEVQAIVLTAIRNISNKVTPNTKGSFGTNRFFFPEYPHLSRVYNG